MSMNLQTPSLSLLSIILYKNQVKGLIVPTIVALDSNESTTY